MFSWRVNFIAQDALLTERLKLYFKREKHLAMCYSTVPEKKGYDIVILPATDLADLTELKLTRVDKWLPVIAYGSHLYLRKAFLTGCFDYLTEPWGPEELLLRLERLIQQLEKHQTLVYGSLSLKDNCLESPAGQTILSYQESQILKLLLRQRGNVVTREVLYYTLWDKQPDHQSRVVDVHISSLKKKLAGHGFTRIIVSVRGQGYMLL